ncbi:MAG: DUF3750 domain-containing protein [Pseudomonadota bacterium]
MAYSLGNYLLAGDSRSWWQQERSSSQQAPDPALHKEAIIQVYAARAVRWRGALGVHTWIAVKPQNAEHYSRIEVFGFYLRRYGSTVTINQRSPNSYWFGSTPVLLREVRGRDYVDKLIHRIYEAVDQYPYDTTYRLWPGPNSNTFIAWLGRAIPELQLELPVTAIGKDYLPGGVPLARTPSGTGIQISLGGMFGVMVAKEEGIEVNLLGFAAGIDFSPLAIKLPGVGRIGHSDFKSGQNHIGFIPP